MPFQTRGIHVTERPEGACDQVNNPGLAQGKVVFVDSANTLDSALGQAVMSLRHEATKTRAGILITRLEPGRYEVTLRTDIPYGVIRNRFGSS